VERVDEEAFGMKFVCDILSTGGGLCYDILYTDDADSAGWW